MTPEQRALAARLASFASWANTADPSTRTEPGRAAFNNRFEREVDPDGRLTEDERRRRAEAARKAYFTRLALASSQARARKKRKAA